MVVTDNDGLTPEQRAKIESVMPMDWKAELERANAEIARLHGDGIVTCFECGSPSQSLSQNGCLVCGAWFTVTNIAGYLVEAESALATLREENEKLTDEVEHFAALACDDLGKNPPMFWKDEVVRLREALDLKTVAYDEVSRDVVALREENERLRVAGQAVLDAKGTARRYAAKANLRATLATPKTEGRRDV